MSTQNFDTLDTPEQLEKKPVRVFLVSLVSLTFIASALKLFLSLFYFADFRAPQSYLDESWLRWQILCMILFGFSAIVAVTAAVMMLQRKKRAFTLCLFAQVIMTGSVCCFYLSATQINEGNNFLALFGSFITLLFTVAFTILYHFALKPYSRNAER